MLADAEAEMALRPAIDVVDVGVGNFRRSRLPEPKASATLSPTRMLWPWTVVSRMTARLKRCADVLKRSDSSIAGSISAGVCNDAAARIGMIVQIEREHAHEAR